MTYRASLRLLHLIEDLLESNAVHHLKMSSTLNLLFVTLQYELTVCIKEHEKKKNYTLTIYIIFGAFV